MTYATGSPAATTTPGNIAVSLRPINFVWIIYEALTSNEEAFPLLALASFFPGSSFILFFYLITYQSTGVIPNPLIPMPRAPPSSHTQAFHGYIN